VLDLADFSRAERATGGFDTTVWRLERGHRQYALRVFRADQRRVLDRELIALRAAAAAGLPVPQVYATGTFDERPALLQEWCAGQPLVAAMRARPAAILALGHGFGRLHARLHRVPAPPGLRTSWIDWGGPIDAALRQRLVASSERRPARLLHMDWHPLNVLVEDGRPTAILDWTNAHGGDPRADVARTLSILRLSPPRGSRSDRLGRRLLELGWRAGYGSFGPAADMAPFYAWAGAAMLYDLRNRFGPSELAHVARWTARWRSRAEL
jgi:aminoglycoside phosphotransferase (APT) family kinase protein